MFTFNITHKLQNKLKKIGKKDPVFARIFKRKLKEIIAKDKTSINTYKNLRSPMNDLKRIHLTDNYILLFRVYSEKRHILFVDILHRVRVYK